MIAIFKREIRAYFTSPLGYFFIAVFLILNGAIFALCTLQQGSESNLARYFTSILFAFVILIPLLTMRSFAEERKAKTEQLLLTSPVTLPGMVCGKFFASYVMFLMTLLVGLFDLYPLYKFSEDAPNTPRIIGYIIGIALVGAAFVAVGIFISSLTENQLIASLGTMAVLLLFLVTSFLNDYIPFPWLRSVLSWFSIYSRYGNFTYGYFDFAALLYYASICFVFLFLTVRVYEKRRWS